MVNEAISYQPKLIKMRAELASLNPCAVPFLSHAVVNLSWYDITYNTHMDMGIFQKSGSLW